MILLQTNSCAALFYAIRQFYAIAIFFMGRLDTYGVWQKLWGGLRGYSPRPPHSFCHIALLGAKAWPCFSYSLKVVNVYACSHSSWGTNLARKVCGERTAEKGRHAPAGPLLSVRVACRGKRTYTYYIWQQATISHDETQRKSLFNNSRKIMKHRCTDFG